MYTHHRTKFRTGHEAIGIDPSWLYSISDGQKVQHNSLWRFSTTATSPRWTGGKKDYSRGNPVDCSLFCQVSSSNFKNTIIPNFKIYSLTAIFVYTTTGDVYLREFSSQSLQQLQRQYRNLAGMHHKEGVNAKGRALARQCRHRQGGLRECRFFNAELVRTTKREWIKWGIYQEIQRNNVLLDYTTPRWVIAPVPTDRVHHKTKFAKCATF